MEWNILRDLELTKYEKRDQGKQIKEVFMTKFNLRLAVVGLSMCFFLFEGPLRASGQSLRAQQRGFLFHQNLEQLQQQQQIEQLQRQQERNQIQQQPNEIPRQPGGRVEREQRLNAAQRQLDQLQLEREQNQMQREQQLDQLREEERLRQPQGSHQLDEFRRDQRLQDLQQQQQIEQLREQQQKNRSQP